MCRATHVHRTTVSSQPIRTHRPVGEAGVRRRWAALLPGTIALCAAAGLASDATAGDLQVIPPRSLGMGGALRGSAAGGGAMMLNPSGMSLQRSYVVEGSYHFLNREQGHLGHVSVVDSTSGFNVGGGLYYTYATASPDQALLPQQAESSRHEAGVALSFPFGDRVILGGTLRYLRARREATTSPAGVAEKTSGLTYDAGLTVRPVRMLTIGLVGYALRDLDNAQAPKALGGGVALTPTDALIIAVDGLVDFRTSETTPGRTLSVFGGAEYTFLSRVALRGGGGRGGARERTFGTLGVSLLSEVGALDFAGRTDLRGSDKDIFIGLAGRLFVPTP
jgi:hypothetical protein